MTKNKEHALLLNEAIVNKTKAEQTQAKARYYKSRYNEYSEKVGIEKSCYTPRDHGPDISLMTEIVDRCVFKESLFPIPIEIDEEVSANSDSFGDDSE